MTRRGDPIAYSTFNRDVLKPHSGDSPAAQLFDKPVAIGVPKFSRVFRALALLCLATLCACAQQPASTSPIQPIHLPQSIGLSPQSIGLSPQSIGLAPRSVPSLSATHERGHAHPNRKAAVGIVPVFAAPYIAPYSDTEPAADTEAAPATDQPALSEQLRHLSDQLRDLQIQLAQSAPAAPSEPAPADELPTPSTPAITVVLKTGQSFQTQSYAVIGDTFWDLSSEPARKFPLVTLNVPASQKLTAANGAEFPAIQTK